MAVGVGSPTSGSHAGVAWFKWRGSNHQPMTDDREAVLDAMEWLLDRFESDDAVAYAEVGGVYQEKTDAVVTHDGPRERNAFTETGVWLRVFARGAADYRYTTSLDEESLTDEADRAVRAGEALAQEEPGRFDAYTLHRAAHDGWAGEPIDAVDLAAKVATVEEGLTAADDLDLRRAWANYTDAHVEEAVGSTTGSTVRTTLDRASTTLVLTLADGTKVRRHAGSTAGAPFLEDLPDAFADAAADARALATADPVDVPTGETTVVLSPRAAGQLFHLLSHYLEADAALMGLSPYAVGDRVGPADLAIEDAVHAGSWGARAYDAELRPTTPTQLVADGRIERFLHNTTSAADGGAFPAGNAVPSLGRHQPPRIHARHLEVAPGDADRTELLADAAVYVERFDQPWLREEFERVQRAGVFPPSVLYAKDLERKVDVDLDVGRADLPLAEAYRLDDGEQGGRIDGISLAVDPGTLRGISALGTARETMTGTCEKHKSRLPFAVTAPPVRLRASLEAET